MALAHGLTLWIAAGAMVFALFYFPPLLQLKEPDGAGIVRRILLSPLRLLQVILAGMRFPRSSSALSSDQRLS
jgi:hypothetical protein